jgi:hypothetical protein
MLKRLLITTALVTTALVTTALVIRALALPLAHGADAVAQTPAKPNIVVIMAITPAS